MSTSASLTMTKLLTVWITTNCRKFFKRWEYQTTLPASWEACMHVKKQQLELDMEEQTGSKLETGSNFVQMQNIRLDEAEGGIKTSRRNICNSDMQMTSPLWQIQKSLLMKMKEESIKASLKLNIQKLKIMASSPIFCWQIGKQWKQ